MNCYDMHLFQRYLHSISKDYLKKFEIFWGFRQRGLLEGLQTFMRFTTSFDPHNRLWIQWSFLICAENSICTIAVSFELWKPAQNSAAMFIIDNLTIVHIHIHIYIWMYWLILTIRSTKTKDVSILVQTLPQIVIDYEFLRWVIMAGDLKASIEQIL